MLITLQYGVDAGRTRDFPFHVASALVKAGRAVRVDDATPDPTTPEPLQTVTTARTHRDPVPAASGRRTTRARR